MAFRSGSTPTEFNTTSGNHTVQAGVVAGDYCLLVVWGATNTSNETPVTVTPTKAGVTFNRVTTTPNFPETDNNMWSDVFVCTGLVAGDTINVGLSAARSTSVTLLAWTSALSGGSAGNMFERGGVSGSTNVTPSMACLAGQDVYVLTLDRVASAGTTISSYVNSNGRAMTTDFYAKAGATGGQVSVGVAHFTETGTATGTTTVTYSNTSGNGQSLHILQPLAGSPGVLGDTLTSSLNRLAGTSGLSATNAANVWAGTTNLTLVDALNVKAGNSLPNYKALGGVCNQLASTSDLSPLDALSRIIA